MKLAYWMYLGPAHIGTLRVTCSFRNVHAIMHAPLGDDYFNVMRSMLERKREFTPVTTSVVDRHVLARGSQQKVIHNITRKGKEETPDLVILTPTCTSSILQEDLQNFVEQASFDSKMDILLADVNHYRVNELQAADKTLLQIVQFYLSQTRIQSSIIKKTLNPSVNIIGALNLSFHVQHDIAELKRLLADLNIEVNLIIPEGASVNDLQRLPQAWCNIVPYREVGLQTAQYLEKQFEMPFVTTTPIGTVGTAAFIREIGQILQSLEAPFFNYESYIQRQTRFISQATWFSHSIDCQNLTGKQAVVFGDATHAAALTKILALEMGIHVLFAGTFCRNESDWFYEEVRDFCDEVVISDDHNLIGDLIAKLEPSAIFGTQMERHVGKRLNIPCAVISTPVHIQNFPLSYRPFLGYEGANQIMDLIYNSFTLGMEDHLLELFSGHDTKSIGSKSLTDSEIWSLDAQAELSKIPGFVRGKIKRKTEKFAQEAGIRTITVEVMYAAREAVMS
uniref:Light-independent protochlorophyllide reductase subunit B n=1 Tax=Rhizochromulina marina TaxID=1034831 RepID=A0A514CQ20_9STRA|nr:light-independent protochlorophyllide reductase subunit B [Rhizochromulina marina]QDH81903.1 light-independent protochlorophyllide reductase subunit B [Rhizochromulina marina]